MKNKTPLYYLTTKNDKTEIEIPAEVPHTSIARGLEDKTKRIAFYNSVDDALCVLSIGRGNLSGQVLSVYSPSYLNSNNILPPDPNLVPYKDKLEGKENWVLLDSLRLIKVCDIVVDKKIGTRKFKYGDRIVKKANIKEGEMTEYEWNEVLPEWDKKGKTMKLKRQKTFSASIPTSKAAEEAYKKWQEGKDPKDAKKFMDIWTREVYIPARKKGIMVDPDPAIVDAASGHIKHPEWIKKKGQKNFGSTAAQATEDKPVAREAGLIGGSALIGLGGGIGIKGLADKAPEIADKARETVIFKPARKGEARIARWKDGSKQLEKVEKIHKAARKKAEGVQKFAKTKGGKATLIGIPTAVIGGLVYKSAKKKKKSDKKEGEAK